MSTARIVDRSYRSYEGPRGGVGTSMLTVVKHSIQRSLGIKRTIWQKVLPAFTIAISFNDSSPAARSNSTSRSAERRRPIVAITACSSARCWFRSTS